MSWAFDTLGGCVSKRSSVGTASSNAWGRGGAATVWLACDEAGERVALKILHPALAADDDYRERLLREARTVNSIRGGGVSHILDIEIDATQPFVVLSHLFVVNCRQSE